MSTDYDKEQWASYAKQLLDNPVYKQVFLLIKAQTIQNLTKRKGWFHRNRILEDQRRLKAISDVEGLIGRYIQDGKRVQSRLKQVI